MNDHRARADTSGSHAPRGNPASDAPRPEQTVDNLFGAGLSGTPSVPAGFPRGTWEPGGAGGQSSAFRALLYLIWLSWQRQARARQMVWIALGLLVFAAGF